jgi:hypothetical protein
MLSITPNTAQAGNIVTVTAVDTNAQWLITSPQFIIASGSNLATLGSADVINGITATFTLSTGIEDGSVTIVELTTGDAAVFTVTGIAGETEQSADTGITMDFTYYGTMAEAEQYFAMRLHEFAWTAADPKDKPKALLAATRIIDALDFKGVRHTVWELLKTLPYEYSPTDVFVSDQLWRDREAEIRAACELQPLEFPRGSDTEVPMEIRRACYEIAYSLLDGKDPEMELENLQVTSHGYGEVRAHYERNMGPIEHLINMCPSSLGWNILRPFLRDSQMVQMSRVT